MKITAHLIAWYNDNKRDLPWRHTKDPYHIWLSEIILQQTRVNQGLPYYNKFVNQYPKITDLAKADEQEVLSLWQGLGYYSRARNMHAAAKKIVSEHNEIFPNNYKDILALNGVGTYTAAAIGSFAFDLPHPVIDGNVIRFISRLFAIALPVDKSEGRKAIELAVNEVFDPKHAASWNQAIMEFGAMHCTPKKPLCDMCPFQEKCLGYAQNMVASLPVKAGKTKVKNIEQHYFVFIHKNDTYIEQRTQGTWKNMYQFPMYEENLKASQIGDAAQELLKDSIPIKIQDSFATKHILSHRNISAFFHTIPVDSKPFFLKSDIFEVDLAQLGTKYPISVLIQKYLNYKKDT